MKEELKLAKVANRIWCISSSDNEKEHEQWSPDHYIILHRDDQNALLDAMNELREHLVAEYKKWRLEERTTKSKHWRDRCLGHKAEVADLYERIFGSDIVSLLIQEAEAAKGGKKK